MDGSGLCGDCKFWTKDFVVAAYGDHGECELTRSSFSSPDVDSTLAYASDYEEYKAALKTLPTFGCIQFQPASSE